MPDVLVNSFTHLKDRPKADEALKLLQRLASLVKPIMRKHGWILPILSEFFPDDPRLLGMNVNSGQKILVRLRPYYVPDTFYDEEHIVGTMLHELTHNVHAPHNDKFYEFLSALEDEYDALRLSGYSGEGFHSKGYRLGTNVSHNLPLFLARQKALEAAEKRRQVSIVLSGGGRKLGGGLRSNKSSRELAAEAAERRACDEQACASGPVAEREAEKAAKESVQDDVIDLTSDSDSEQEPEIIIVGADSSSPTPCSLASSTPTSTGALSLSPSSASLNTLASSVNRPGSGYTTATSSTSTLSAAGHAPRPTSTVHRVPRGAGDSRPTLPKPRSLSRPPSRAHHKRPPTPPPTRAGSISASRHNAVTVNSTEEQWTCPCCTLINDPLALQCAACLGMRPTSKEREQQQDNDWMCTVCGEKDIPRDFWTCRYCGSVKMSSA